MALIPPFFLDCVVAIGKDHSGGGRKWIASGFLYGHFVRRQDEQTTLYSTYLVSNRHVLQGQKLLYLRFNPKGAEPAREYTLDFEAAQNAAVCHSHPDPDIDVAVVRVNANVLRTDGIQFSQFFSNKHVAGRECMKDLGIMEGDFVYVLGFPMGLVGEQRNFVVVRQGTVARIRDYLAEASKEVLLDCTIFPGNSGGPVVSKPDAVAVQGTKSQNAAYLLGIVARSIEYQDVAVSVQTRRPRVVFEDNSGLASIVPVQYLVDLIQGLVPCASENQGEAAHTDEANNDDTSP